MTHPADKAAASAALRAIVLIWAGWAVLILGFQAFAPARLPIARPDHALPWTADETRVDSHKAQPYLLGRALNAQVAWDSEYYLSIALHGYRDPAMRAIAPGSTLGAAQVGLAGQHPDWIPVSAAFFPGYPMAMRLVALPLRAVGVEPLAAATIAGVLVSLGGTLAAMLALFDLARRGGAPGDADRAAVYLLLWPASFFLAQVYSEGLFLGLSFGALALIRRGRWGWAALLAAGAVWTRATGALLLIPFAWTFVEDGGLEALRRPSPRASLRLVAALSPAVAYAAWRAVFGARFSFVEENFFGRGVLWLTLSLNSWREALQAVGAGEPQASAYYVVELAGLAAAAVTSLALLRRDPALALYGLAVVAVALTSGAAQGMHRYVLSLPALFLVPARWGRARAFDRLWSLAGALGMAVFALAFSVDFWAG